MSELEERHAEIARLFREFKQVLMALLPSRYPEMQTYEQWRSVVLSNLDAAEHCAKHASDHLSEENHL